MKKILVTAILTLIGLQAYAEYNTLSVQPFGLYDFIAPSVYGTPSQLVVGQIYYDTQSGIFKGVNDSGSAISLSTSSGNVVTSNSSNERIERLKATCNSTSCTAISQSNGWVSSVSRTGTGAYTVNFTGGTFSASPSCTVWAGNGSGNIGFSNSSAYNNSTSTFSFSVATSGAPVDASFDMLCMGPKQQYQEIESGSNGRFRFVFFNPYKHE